MSLKPAFETAEKNENKDGNGVFWRYLKTIWNFYVKTCGCSPLTPLVSNFIVFLDIFILDISRKRCRYVSAYYR